MLPRPQPLLPFHTPAFHLLRPSVLCSLLRPLTLSLAPLQMSVATQCDPEEIIVLSDSD